KDLIRPQEAKFKFDEKGLREKQKTTPETRRNRYAGKVHAVKTKLEQVFEDESQRNLVKSSEKGVPRGKGQVFNSPSLQTILKTLADKTKHPRIVRNAAYVLLGGRRIAKYDKRADYAETRGAFADDLAFIPGTEKQCPAIDGYRFGVEICFDHQLGV